MSEDEFDIWTVVLPALGVTFAAFCVCLGVRLVNREWRPGRRFWIACPILVLLCYPLSFGPAWWMASRGNLPAKNIARVIYSPLIEAAIRSKGPFRWWADLGAVRRGRYMEFESLVIWHDLDIPYQQTTGLTVNWD